MSFSFGPYFLQPKDGYWSIDELQAEAAKLHGKDSNTVKTGIRKWMTAMHQDANRAQQTAQRCYSVLSEANRAVFQKAVSAVKREGIQGVFYPAADMLDVNTIQNQETKVQRI